MPTSLVWAGWCAQCVDADRSWEGEGFAVTIVCPWEQGGRRPCPPLPFTGLQQLVSSFFSSLSGMLLGGRRKKASEVPLVGQLR